MRFGPGPAILAVVLSFAAAPGWAEDCPAKSTGMDDKLGQLRQLGELHTQGVLSDAEFDAQKSRILSGP